MEKLEKKIRWPDSERLRMIEKSQFYENDRVYQYGYYDGYQCQNDKVQDIAIAFAKKVNGLVIDTEAEIWQVDTGDGIYETTPTALFTEFIKQYYK